MFRVCCILLLFMNGTLLGYKYDKDSNIRGQQQVKPRTRLRRQALTSASSDHDDNSTKKIRDPEWYTTSYYTTSEETEPSVISTVSVTPTTTESQKAAKMPDTTSAKPIIIADNMFNTPGGYFQDSMTAEAWAALPHRDQKKYRDEERYFNLKWWRDYNKLEQEEYDGIYNYMGGSDRITHFNVMCYQLGSTLFNAKKNLRDYYRVRFAYHDNKFFEIGYIVHEIIHKYSVLLELFHSVQFRYYNQSGFFNIAPETYMIYMYTVILEQSQDIIHLCNVLHEVDDKYGDVEQLLEVAEKQLNDLNKGIQAQVESKVRFWLEEKMQNEKEIRNKKRLRKEKYDIEKSGIFKSTRRVRRPKTQGRLNLHYGWSVEYW